MEQGYLDTLVIMIGIVWFIAALMYGTYELVRFIAFTLHSKVVEEEFMTEDSLRKEKHAELLSQKVKFATAVCGLSRRELTYHREFINKEFLRYDERISKYL